MSRKAIALNPELAEGHKALGLTYFVKGAYRESLAATRRAAKLNPNLAPATANVGYSLFVLGRPDEALPWLLRAVELDPKISPPPAGVGGCYAVLGDVGQAERWLKRSLEIQPDSSQVQAFLIWLYLQERRGDEARQQVRKAMTLLPDDPRLSYTMAIAELTAGNSPGARKLFEHVLSAFQGTRIGTRTSGAGVETHLAYLHLRAGERRQAETLLEKSLEADRQAAKEGNEDWSVPYDTACVHALRGEKDEAFRWLDKAVEAGWRGWPLGTRDPLLDSLRGDPRFGQLEASLETLINQMRRRAGLT